MKIKRLAALAIISAALAFAPAVEASKLSKWINDKAIPRGPSKHKIDVAADQAAKAAAEAQKTAAEAQKAVNILTPKANRLINVLTWTGGGVLGLLSLLLVGKNVAVWRQALGNRQRV